MALDIYGNNLIKGHCEVHPNVHEEYPCSLCFAESQRSKQNYAEEKKFQHQYEVSFQDQFNIPESFTVTPHLRYAQRQILSAGNNTATFERWLQQMWQGSGGTQEWRWVEEIEE